MKQKWDTKNVTQPRYIKSKTWKCPTFPASTRVDAGKVGHFQVFETDSMFEYDTQFASNVKNKYVAEEYDSVVSFWVKELSRCQKNTQSEYSNLEYSLWVSFE